MGKLGYPGKSHWLLVLIYNAFGRSESSRRGSRLQKVCATALWILRLCEPQWKPNKTNKWASDGIWLGVYYCGMSCNMSIVCSSQHSCNLSHLSCCPGLGISWVCAIPGQPSWNMLEQWTAQTPAGVPWCATVEVVTQDLFICSWYVVANLLNVVDMKSRKMTTESNCGLSAPCDMQGV